MTEKKQFLMVRKKCKCCKTVFGIVSVASGGPPEGNCHTRKSLSEAKLESKHIRDYMR